MAAWRAIRWTVSVCTVAYALGLGALAWLLPEVGERNLTLAFFLFAPRVLFLLPAAPLALASLMCWRPFSLLALLAASGWFFFSGMGWRTGDEPKVVASVPGRTLTVLTFNRGQHGNTSLRPFKRLVSPDIIVFQEAGNRAARYEEADGYEEFQHCVDAGPFTLLSRYPVLSHAPLPKELDGSPLPPAARFEIDFEGVATAVYAVHPPSPRGVLLYYRGGAFLYGLIGLPGTRFEARRLENQRYWDERIAQAKTLLRVIGSDPLPTIVAGDFNAPSGGYIHRLVTEALEDAHLAAGAGFGYSFPGTTRNPLSLGGPWMRIDYLFCDDAWTTEWCLTEKERPSQHRAVAAQFRLLAGEGERVGRP